MKATSVFRCLPGLSGLPRSESGARGIHASAWAIARTLGADQQESGAA